ncbi:histidine--tRNA ligase [Candidatus Margulisiibacteriota bacterium]
MKYSLPRGTRDVLPDETKNWQFIEKTAKKLFSLYNYIEIRTPIFEQSEIFEKSIGASTDIVEKEMYTFKDKSDRLLTLRPEGTAPIVRAYIQNALYKTYSPTKLYYCGPMFRYERPQAGRYRQFYQIGIENIGNAHPFSDAEVISLGMKIFEKLGLTNLTVSINSVGCSVCRPVIEERIKQFIGANLKKFCPNCIRRFDENPLRILDCKNKKCITYLSGLPDIRGSLCHECADHFSSVLESLDSLGIKFIINPTLVRGLDYYTKTAFEIISDRLGAQNAICGGGRYDVLVEQMGGPPTAAVGFAFGMERVVMVLKELKMFKEQESNLVFMAPLGTDQQIKCLQLADSLRLAGIKCDMSYSKTDLKSQLKIANKLNAGYTVIYGEEEAQKNVVLIKNMKVRTQEEVPFKKVKEYFINENLL